MFPAGAPRGRLAGCLVLCWQEEADSVGAQRRRRVVRLDAGADQVGRNAQRPGTRNGTEQDRRQKLQDSVEVLNEFISPHNTSLRFSIDDESGTVVVKVTDLETKEVIKQFPSEEALELAKALDKLKGLLVQQEA